MKSIILTQDFLEKMSGEQLDILYFFVYGTIEFLGREEIMEELEGRQLSPSVMENVEKMLELVKKL